jgi:hypothetical protein
VWLEGLGQLKNPMISLRIEPTTFQLVAQRLSHLCYRMFPQNRSSTNYTVSGNLLVHPAQPQVTSFHPAFHHIENEMSFMLANQPQASQFYLVVTEL